MARRGHAAFHPCGADRRKRASPTEEEGRRSSHPFLFSLKQDQIIPTLQKLMQGFNLVDMGIQEQSLEMVIQRLVRGEPGKGGKAPVVMMRLGWRISGPEEWASGRDGLPSRISVRGAGFGGRTRGHPVRCSGTRSSISVQAWPQVAGMSYIQLIHYTITSVLFSQVRGGDNDFEPTPGDGFAPGQLSNYML